MDECLDDLSPRERDVLALIATGESNKEIAAGLAIRPWTVKNYVEAIFSKLGVHTRTAAAAIWFKGRG